MKTNPATTLLVLAALALGIPACAEDDSAKNDTVDLTQRVDAVTDFLSGGEFGCSARDASGREADISITVGSPRKDRDVWRAEGDFEIRSGFTTLPPERVQFVASQRGRPILSVTGGRLTIRNRGGQATCSFSQTSTDINGQSFTRTFEGTIVRFTPDCYNEQFYLQSQPDIAAVVATNNSFLSGRHHFEEHGRRENRPGCAAPNP